MDSIATPQLKKLKLKEAAEAEAHHVRNLIPPEPWQEVVASKAGSFAGLVSTRLQAGARNGRATIVNARKAHQAIRPVPILGIAERIAYEALTEWVLPTDPFSSPEANAYRKFVYGPIEYALSTVEQRPGLKFSDLDIDYVVQADIAAFYQYVDHAVLLDELQMQTSNIEGSRRVVDLLAEIQGRTFGLPQLIHASDRLAELYMGIIHRDLTRRGFAVWRYNDDFRFAVKGYANAQQVIEDLSAAAQSVGLVLNESKTNILKFVTYYRRHFSATDLEDDELTTLENMEVSAGEYAKEEEQVLLAEAVLFMKRLQPDAKPRLNLRVIDVEETSQLRRSIGVLGRNGDESVLPFVTQVFSIVPQLTPRLCEYLIALADEEVDILAYWEKLIALSSGLNSWQRAWLVYVARRTGLTSETVACSWILSQLERSSGTLLHAESALALAQVNQVEFNVLDEYLRTQPESFTPWYLLAISSLSDLSEEKLKAVRSSSALSRLLIA